MVGYIKYYFKKGTSFFENKFQQCCSNCLQTIKFILFLKKMRKKELMTFEINNQLNRLPFRSEYFFIYRFPNFPISNDKKRTQ